MTSLNTQEPTVLAFLLTSALLFFSGGAAAQSMRTDLTASGDLPASSADIEWQGLPEDITHITIDADNLDTTNNSSISRDLAAGERGIVDWLLIELRIVGEGREAPADPAAATRIERLFALLRSDGSVVNADLPDLTAEDALLSFEDFEFDDAAEDMYLVVNHRNHLGVMSANKLQADTPDATVYTYDFTDAASKSIGGADSIIEKSGVRALRAGDYDNDGNITLADRAAIIGESGNSGYVLGDLDFDSQVDSADQMIAEAAQGRRLFYEPRGGGDRSTPSADYDPTYRWESVGNPNNAQCGTSGAPCRYGVDMRFQKATVAAGNLRFDIGVRAQTEAMGTPGDGGSVDVLNPGNVVEGITTTLYYDSSIFPVGMFGTECTATEASNDAANFSPFNSPITASHSSAPQYVVTLTSAYGAAGPNDAQEASNYFQTTTDEFKTVLSISCALPQAVAAASSFAGIRFDAFNINSFQQLYAANSASFPQIIRFTNSLEFFPLDGTSAYIERAYLADSNHHVGIRFSADMPAGVTPVVEAVQGHYDNLGIRNENLSAAVTYTATEVIRLSDRDIWAVFPAAMKTALDGTNGENLLENILITAEFAGQSDYIAAAYSNTASYRVAVTWGSESSDNSPDSLPPRITDAEFTDTSLGAIALTFSEPVETGIQEVTGESTELTVNDFAVYRWTAAGRVSLPLARVEETVLGDGDKFILHFEDGANLSPGEYVQVFTSSPVQDIRPEEDVQIVDMEGVRSEFYITDSNIFSQKRVMRDLPDLSSDYLAAATGEAAGDLDGEYGIGVRGNPGYGLIQVPQPNRAPTITPATVSINAVPGGGVINVSEIDFVIADADQTSPFPARAQLGHFLSPNFPGALSFDQTAYNNAQPGVGNALRVTIETVGENNDVIARAFTGALTLAQFNALFDYITVRYDRLSEPAFITFRFVDNANGEIGNALRAEALITLVPDTTPPQVADSAITFTSTTGTSVNLAWTPAQDQLGAPADSVICSDNPSICSSDGVTYEVLITDANAPQSTQGITMVATNTIALDRQNVVLIPWRAYTIQIVAIDASGNRSDDAVNAESLRYYTGMLIMPGPSDANDDGIEDSLEGIITDIATYCGGAADADSDGDSRSNAAEVKAGTDCRTTETAEFDDTGLTIYPIDGDWTGTYTGMATNGCAAGEGINGTISMQTEGNRVVLNYMFFDVPREFTAARDGSNTYEFTELIPAPLWFGGELRSVTTLAFTSADAATGTQEWVYVYEANVSFTCSAQLDVVFQRQALVPPVVTLEASQTAAVASWDLVPDDTAFYPYALYTAPTSPSVFILQDTVDLAMGDTQFTLSNLDPGSSYYLEVFSAGASGIAASSATTRSFLTTPMIDPSVDVTSSTAVLSWSVTDGLATTYEFSWADPDSEDPESERSTQEALAQAGSYTVTGLLPHRTYTVRVVARQEGYPDSEPAFLAPFTTEALGDLDVPTLRIVNIGATTAEIEWDQAGIATTYEVSIQGTGIDEDSHPAMAFDDSVSSSALSGLQENTEYTVIVETQAKGYRNGRAEQTFRTKTGLATPQVTTAVDETTLTFSWPAVTGADGYQVNLYLGDDLTADPVGSGRDVKTEAGQVSTEIGMLQPLTEYTIEVTALAPEGSTDLADSPAATATAQTEKLTLPQPTETEVLLSATTNTITVTAIGVPMSSYRTAYPDKDLDYVINLRLSGEANSIAGTEQRINSAATGEPDTYTYMDLQSNTDYEVVVITSSPLTGFFNDSASVSFPIRTDMAPLPMPTGFTVLPADLTAQISWQVADTNKATTYLISYTPGGEEADTVAVSDRTYTLTGLTARTAYMLNIVAQADGYLDSAPFTTMFTTLKSQLPSVLFRVTVGEMTLRVLWDDAVGNATTYTLTLDTAMADATTVEVTALDGSYQFDSLTAATTYTVTLVARAEDYLDSDPSTQTAVTLEVGEMPMLPDQPQNITAVLGTPGDKNVAVSWSQVADTADIVITAYQVLWREAGSSDDQQSRLLSPDTVNYLITGLTPDTDYEITVLSYNVQGASAEGPMRETIMTLREQLLSPAITVSARTVNSVRLEWTVAGGQPDNIVYTYSLRDGMGDIVESSTVEASAGTLTLENLATDAAYTFMVSARLTGYADSEAAEVMFRTLQEQLPVPMAGFSIVPDVLTAQVSWDANRVGDANSYVFSIEGVLTATTIAASAGMYQIVGLEARTTYTLSIVAIASGFRDSDPQTLSFTTLEPQLPAPVISISGITVNQALVIWEEVTDATTYTVSVVDADGNPVGAAVMLAATNRSQSLRGLEAGTNYTVSFVASAPNYRESRASMNFATQLAIPEIAVEDVDAEDGSRTTQTAVLVWTEVVNNASTYELRLSRTDGMGTPRVETVEASAMRYQFDGLTVATNYEVSVVAQGQGYPESEARQVSFKTLDGELETPVVSIASVATTSARIEWEEVLNAEEYEASIRGDGVDAKTHPTTIFDDSDRSSELSGLQEGTEYTVILEARADEYRSSRAEQTFRTKTRLATPQVAAAVDETTLTFSWPEVANADSYQVNLYLGDDLTADPVRSGREVETEAGQVSTEIGMLRPLTEYTIEVIALAPEGSERLADSEAGTQPAQTEKRTLPQPTEAEVRLGATTDTITVSWTGAPANVTSYGLSLSLDSDPDTEIDSAVVDATMPGDYTFTGLTPNTAYLVSVVSSGDEALYNASAALPLPVTTEDLPQLPAPTVDLMHDSEARFAFAVATWDAMGLEASTFEFTLLNAGGNQVLTGSTEINVSAERFMFISSANLGYTLRVVAKGAGFSDSEAQAIGFVTERLRVQTPRLVRVDDIEGNAATVHWDSSNFVNVENSSFPNNADDIRLRFFINDETAPLVENVQATAEMYRLTGLMPVTGYTLGVVAYTDSIFVVRRNSRRATTQFTTLEIKLETPQLEVPQIDEAMVTFSWSEVSEATTYAVSIYSGTDTTTNPVAEELVTTLSYTYTGDPVQQYTIEVIARATGFRDSDATTVTVMTERVTLPAPAFTLSAGDTRILVDWNAAAAGDATTYSLTLSNMAGDTTMESVSVSEGDFTFRRLLSETTYTVSVVAQGDPVNFLDSDPVARSIVTLTEGAMAARPKQPDFNAVVIEPADSVIEVSWTAVPDAERAPILGYTVLWRIPEMADSTAELTADVTRYDITKLQAETSYEVTVLSRNIAGLSVEMERVTVMTLQPQLATPQVSVNEDDIEATSAMLTWEPVMNATTYRITLEGREAVDVAAAAGEYLLEGLAPDTEHTVTVVAVADGFRDSEPQTLSFTTASTGLRLRLRVFLEGPLQ